MKRRAFLAASAFLSLFSAAPALAKPVQKKGATAKTPAKGTAKTAAKPVAKGHGKPALHHRGTTAGLRDTGGGSGFRQSRPMAAASLTPPPQFEWREYQITGKLQAKLPGRGRSRAWIPLPRESDWQRDMDVTWKGNFERIGLKRDPGSDLTFLVADWKDGTTPELEITTRVATRQRLFDITRRGNRNEDEETLQRFLQGSSKLPLDGAIADAAERITGRIREPMPQARAFYDWIIDQPLKSSAASQCASGDLQALVGPGGQITLCDDALGWNASALFVGLCRASGIPARVVYGQRIGESRQFPSLGATGNVATAQHCRAEFYVAAYGWVPVDPADARRAMIQDNLRGDDTKTVALKRRLFGFWEMNWIAYHTGGDVRLPGGPDRPLGWVIAPQVALGDGPEAVLLPADAIVWQQESRGVDS